VRSLGPFAFVWQSQIAKALMVAVALGACQNAPPGKRTLVYWEKWTSFEGEAADELVDAFNAAERAKAASNAGYVPIFVKKVTASQIEQKLLVAVAGGNPPDVAGVYSYMLPAYAEKGALLDLTERLDAANITRGRFIPHFWDLGVLEGRVWGVPTTPASIALHWNKRLFREAGLDPEAPPKTIEELDAFSEKLTRWEVKLPDGTTRIVEGYAPDVPADRKRLLQVGFLPNVPDWWSYGWGYFFGGKLIDGDRVSAAQPENVRAYEWVAGYSRRIGVGAMQRFRSGFGRFSSPQNPFLSGRVAMQLQGVWMAKFIDTYAPGLQWGAAPFPHPADRPDLARSTNAEADMLVVPSGSTHPDEAMAFIEFAVSQEAMERLCKSQAKFSPLVDVSPRFYEGHVNPYIRLFQQLSATPNAFSAPQTGVWNEYLREMKGAVDTIQNLSKPPREALEEVEERMQRSVDRETESRQRRRHHDGT
jgi:ABC-type glycerol-3-phosphate transport system substrate-binding protein